MRADGCLGKGGRVKDKGSSLVLPAGTGIRELHSFWVWQMLKLTLSWVIFDSAAALSVNLPCEAKIKWGRMNQGCISTGLDPVLLNFL